MNYDLEANENSFHFIFGGGFYHFSWIDLGDDGLDCSTIIQALHIDEQQTTRHLDFDLGRNKFRGRFANGFLPQDKI